LKAEQKTIHDPVYGAIAADELEWLLIQSHPLQRLKGIKQLGLVDAVFPGANHTRFEHSLGTMHMAGLIARHLDLEPLETRKVRLAGLLHDLGHSAFSHAVEGVLSRNPEIQPQISEKRAAGHEEFTREIIGRRPFGERALARAEETFGNAEALFREVAEIAVGHSRPLGQIISGDLDADRVDFLLRDSHHCGVSLGLVDVDQIVQSLTIHRNRVVLAGSDDYRADMSQTAAESILVARAHHYNALIHHPQVQSLRTMLLAALESALECLDAPVASSRIALFFQKDTDHDLLRFVYEKGDERCRKLLSRIGYCQPFPLAARFDHRTLPPGTRMALSTISRGGRMRKLFEQGLAKRYGALVDISVGSGVPRSIRTETDRFLYDESALAAGLVKSLTRQIALSIFSDSDVKVSPEEIRELAFKLLSFIRAESYLPIDGLLLLFYSLHKMLSESFGERILVPRIRNITWLYRTVARLRAEGGAGLAGLFDYSFHDDYGFPYSEKLFEDIQILVATGMIFQDMRHFEMGRNWLQRYEYMLSAEGLEYAQGVVGAYRQEAEMVAGYLKGERHNIPHDMTSLLKKRYSGGR